MYLHERHDGCYLWSRICITFRRRSVLVLFKMARVAFGLVLNIILCTSWSIMYVLLLPLTNLFILCPEIQVCIFQIFMFVQALELENLHGRWFTKFVVVLGLGKSPLHNRHCMMPTFLILCVNVFNRSNIIWLWYMEQDLPSLPKHLRSFPFLVTILLVLFCVTFSTFFLRQYNFFSLFRQIAFFPDYYDCNSVQLSNKSWNIWFVKDVLIYSVSISIVCFLGFIRRYTYFWFI